MTRRHAVMTVLVPAALAGCGASVQATRFPQNDAPARPVDAPVEIFSTRVPECPYDELGLLRADVRSPLTPRERVMEGFLARARKMGGEAIVLDRLGNAAASGSDDRGSPYRLAGTVIRFRSADCRR